jgi:hypothetical protein
MAFRPYRNARWGRTVYKRRNSIFCMFCRSLQQMSKYNLHPTICSENVLCSSASMTQPSNNAQTVDISAKHAKTNGVSVYYAQTKHLLRRACSPYWPQGSIMGSNNLINITYEHNYQFSYQVGVFFFPFLYVLVTLHQSKHRYYSPSLTNTFLAISVIISCIGNLN